MESAEIEVSLFAGVAEALGTRTIQVVLPEQPTVGELLKLLQTRYTNQAHLISRCVCVINDERYATNSDLLELTDRVALIPPVSGGSS
ncbi:MAG: MoaD/ThiS family protein [Zavarzinella sp.]